MPPCRLSLLPPGFHLPPCRLLSLCLGLVELCTHCARAVVLSCQDPFPAVGLTSAYLELRTAGPQVGVPCIPASAALVAT